MYTLKLKFVEIKSDNDVSPITKKKRKYECNSCDYKAYRSEHLRFHKKFKHEGGKLVCTKCQKNFTSRDGYNNHVKNSICEKKSTKGVETLKLPSIRNDPIRNENCMENWQCGICEVKFSTDEQLKCHLISIHLKSKPYICNECRQVFDRRVDLIQHFRFDCIVPPPLYWNTNKESKKCKKTTEISSSVVLKTNIEVPLLDNDSDCLVPVTTVPVKLIGLNNIRGNSCYCNVVLQVLLNLDSFVEKLNKKPCERKIGCYPVRSMGLNEKACLVCLLLQTLVKYNKCNNTMSPVEIYDKKVMGDIAPSIEFGRQNDAHFLFQAVCSKIDVDLFNIVIKVTRTYHKCPICKEPLKISSQEESSTEIRICGLSSKSIQDGIDKNLNPEFLVNQPCRHCKTERCSTVVKRTIILAPPTLCIIVNRFERENGVYVKRKFNVKHQRNCYLTMESGNKVPYTLHAIIRHHGERTESGHYTSIIKKNEHLYNIDDSVINGIDNEDLELDESYVIIYTKETESEPQAIQQKQQLVRQSPVNLPFESYESRESSFFETETDSNKEKYCIQVPEQPLYPTIPPVIDTNYQAIAVKKASYTELVLRNFEPTQPGGDIEFLKKVKTKCNVENNKKQDNESLFIRKINDRGSQLKLKSVDPSEIVRINKKRAKQYELTPMSKEELQSGLLSDNILYCENINQARLVQCSTSNIAVSNWAKFCDGMKAKFLLLEASKTKATELLLKGNLEAISAKSKVFNRGSKVEEKFNILLGPKGTIKDLKKQYKDEPDSGLILASVDLADKQTGLVVVNHCPIGSNTIKHMYEHIDWEITENNLDIQAFAYVFGFIDFNLRLYCPETGVWVFYKKTTNTSCSYTEELSYAIKVMIRLNTVPDPITEMALDAVIKSRNLITSRTTATFRFTHKHEELIHKPHPLLCKVEGSIPEKKKPFESVRFFIYSGFRNILIKQKRIDEETSATTSIKRTIVKLRLNENINMNGETWYRIKCGSHKCVRTTCVPFYVTDCEVNGIKFYNQETGMIDNFDKLDLQCKKGEECDYIFEEENKWLEILSLRKLVRAIPDDLNPQYQAYIKKCLGIPENQPLYNVRNNYTIYIFDFK